MSKKDYQNIAATIYATREGLKRIGVMNMSDVVEVTGAIADMFAANNPRFDRIRFVEACETGKCKGMKVRS